RPQSAVRVEGLSGEHARVDQSAFASERLPDTQHGVELAVLAREEAGVADQGPRGAGADALVVEIVHPADEMAAAAGEARPHGRFEKVHGAVAAAGATRFRADVDPFHPAVEDDVDDARTRARAISGRGAAGDDIDAFHQ